MANAIISAVIVIALMFYQRGGARHRPLISLMAYFTVLVYASVPFRYLFGLYHESHWFGAGERPDMRRRSLGSGKRAPG
jgi:hypothetical protein